MRLAPVYAKFDLQLSSAQGAYLYKQDGTKILDFYSGHGVISIGHSHPLFVERMKAQLDRLVYYSNAVDFSEQIELCASLGPVSGCPDYDIFLANSGAEAVENALKVASYHSGRTQVVALRGSFHGRTSLAAQMTDASKICAPINSGLDVIFIDRDDCAAAQEAITSRTAAVIVEAIQGVGGIHEPSTIFWQNLSRLCKEHGALLIADEIQAGFGRSGQFFAFQKHGVTPDLICTAKGMGNGYPVAATWISPGLSPAQGSLGTTFGGNPLACVAAKTVADVLDSEQLIARADALGEQLKNEMKSLPGLTHVRGRGLMLAFDLETDSYALRSKLLHQGQVITGNASSKETVRLLPPLCITADDCDVFLSQLRKALR